MSPNAGGWGGGGSGGKGCWVSANEYSCAYGAQINFGDLTPYLTYEVYMTVCSYCSSAPIPLPTNAGRINTSLSLLLAFLLLV
jgi:hypothetical protein